MLAPIQGFAPDADPTKPGVLTDCTARVPTLKGMKAAPSASNIALPALAAAALGAATLTKLDETKRLFAGTTTKLYEAASSSWTDVTRTAGNYSAGSDLRWRFAQYGNVSLAVQKGDKLQQINAAAQFEDVTAAPKASIVEVAADFAFLFDTNEATYSDSPDRWWCSALGDFTDWTPAVATNCYTGRLRSVAGAIRAGRRLGSDMVAYKAHGMYHGAFLGPPLGWDFREISNFAGALSQEVVVPIVTKQGGAAHIIMGSEDFYYYDGSRPAPMGNPLKNWLYARLNPSYAYRSAALHDPVNALIRFYYPSTSSTSGALDSCVVYNYRTDRWGVDDRTIECATEWKSGGLTYATLASTYATYADIPSISYGSPFWFSGTPVPLVFNSSHVPQTLNGAAGASSYTTGDIGEDEQVLTLSRVRPRYLTAPTTASMVNYHRFSLGDALTQDATTALASGKFDVQRESRWHRVKVSETGESEVPALDVVFEKAGEE